jgi:hypothetical protein
MIHNALHRFTSGRAPWLLSLAVIAAAGCSGCGTSEGQPADSPRPISPELKARIESAKNQRERKALYREVMDGE